MEPKYCKVTVRRASPQPTRPRRQTVGADVDSTYHQLHAAAFRSQRPMPMADRDLVTYVQEDEDASEDIAVLSEDAPPVRRRANTTATGVEVIKGRVLNPLSRMTLRWTEHDKPAAVSSTASGSTTPEMPDTPPPILDFGMAGDLTNSFLDVDTDGHDPERKTLDDPNQYFLAGTPPIPAGITLDMLPTEDSTPPIPSHLRNTLRVKSGRSFEPMPTIATLARGHEDDDTDDDMDDASSAATSDYLDSHDRAGVIHEEMASSVDIDSIMQSRAQALARFEASMSSMNASRGPPRFRTTDMPASIARDLRGLSSPPRMMSTVIRQHRKGTVANDGNYMGVAGGFAADHTPMNAEPLYHGQELHLCFKTGAGQLTQVAGHPKRRGHAPTNPFSRRIRCHSIAEDAPLEDLDTLRIIGHTTDGQLRGGDCISLARTDGTVLRMQKMSKKLTFSSKIDVRSKFIITGVPENTLVTSVTKFYLQSVYDRSKTVGFLRSKRAHHPGCLAVYATGSNDDKTEPTQFFKRETSVGGFHGFY